MARKEAMKGHGRYILDINGEPVYEPKLTKWAQWFEGSFSGRRVERTQIGPYLISTVFLGLDHNYFGEIPILWETMVFGPGKAAASESEALECDRCGGSREQAQAMHAAMVERMQAMIALQEV